MSIGVSNPKIQYVELDDDKKIPIKKLGIKKYALICGSLRKILKKLSEQAEKANRIESNSNLVFIDLIIEFIEENTDLVIEFVMDAVPVLEINDFDDLIGLYELVNIVIAVIEVNNLFAIGEKVKKYLPEQMEVPEEMLRDLLKNQKK